MPFDKKSWLDDHVVPHLNQSDPPLSLYSVFWNGSPPKDVLVYLLAQPERWAFEVRRLLTTGFVFDFTRDVAIVELEGKRTAIFGGDGTPMFDKNGSVAVRLFQKNAAGNLILHVGAKCGGEGGLGAGVEAAALVKTFFGQFDQDPRVVCQTYAARFGQA